MTYFHEDFPDYNPLDLEYIPLRSDDKSGKKMKQKSKKKHESMAAFRSKVSGLDLLGGGGGGCSSSELLLDPRLNPG